MAAIKTCHSCLIIFLVLFIVSLPTFSSAEEEADDGNHQYGNFISLELIHRDSPKSPLYSPAQSTWQRLANALQRSNHRANHFEKSLSKLIASANNNKNNTAQSELFPSGGEYLMNISLGNPPLSIVAIADTGSDLIWTQCKPCPSNLESLDSEAENCPSLISGPRHGKVFSTPLLLNGTQSYYYLALKAVSVGHKKFDLERNNNNIIVSKANFKGNIIIDSGTTLTYLPTKLYNRLELEMRKEVKHLELANDPNQVLTLCYKTKSDDIDVPVVTFHFDGADVELKAVNTFLRVEKYVICFAFTSTEGILIYGNVAQINFQVQYGLTKKTLSFKPTDCTK
ncbi:Aspartic peptidase [Parasponia andersonii]|uniref:Aspartic peptidase n=1 Tax=Parasponia andersonii TaxID=3476 RepID=A0A2P5C6H9_PARAD|nr:Aspartic peptidase [Parasponia andersonii]